MFVLWVGHSVALTYLQVQIKEKFRLCPILKYKHYPTEASIFFSGNVWSLISHIFQVCGLKWSYNNRQLASGGNDNRVRCLSISCQFGMHCSQDTDTQVVFNVSIPAILVYLSCHHYKNCNHFLKACQPVIIVMEF